ncbi:bifunctional 3-deoxy-7-phosphoheptulonate synthase/chorismate mutase [Fictibacillus sp. WQ 8-8]|uniref:bifunctional 3-deoxy-7-phosphoheptulonate synthase/chorismate mutase n=1 Tax=Fictibacillus sp. WQ 8-8 TaxID=2938788 RepID=UPI00210C3BD3|nr:bifunctional 3-deoxy-7-phosphoheptulonate synthase/chorismate mutase [Fictibacillus sp. WQ 8-8]MCQ6266603.1 bifunctional 3-deoxy-7-phosphoheptulonate synthase/chorismate mutase [Fictibacillus sp. WQ 8-8]
MSIGKLDELRDLVKGLDLQLLDLLNRREAMLQENEALRLESTIALRDKAKRQKEGPLCKDVLLNIIKVLEDAGQNLDQMQARHLLVSRKRHPENTVVSIKGEKIGNGIPYLIAGPCAVESEQQLDEAAKAVKAQGLTFMRGGAFKPRTSPYDFQGLGIEGLKLLRQAGNKHGLAVISEIVDPRDLEAAEEYLDIIQIGARNMQNFELLKEAGKMSKPVLLKRGLAATIEEFIYSAEYVMASGNDQIILCERGIRTYEKATRNTLDITAVPILKQETHLPVFVDVTHSTGRKDLLVPAAKAALAIGADGIMAEVHPHPELALSDSAQQMNPQEFQLFVDELSSSGLYKRTGIYA